MSTDSSLSKWEDQLEHMLDKDDLITELYSKGVLGDELYRKLRDEKDRRSEIDLILHLANERQCEFCEALNETHQGHITNYIRRKGVRPGDDDDGNWPLYGTSQWDKLRKNLLKLIELTDSYHGLVDEMVEADCITDQQAENIYNMKEHAARNRKLFDTLKLRSITAYHRFIDCLLKTNQPHVASLLEPAKGGEVQPLSPEYQGRLRSNYATLSKHIDVKIGGLLALMYEEKCLDRRQMEAIQANATSATDSARLLLDILLRSSQPTFDCFMRCLEKDRQKHLHKLLLGNVTCAQIDASLSGTENIKETEELTVEKIKSQWLCLPRDEQKRTIRELSDLWSSNDVELLTAEVGHSIRLYFLCGSSAGVQFLRKVYDNGDLCSIVQRLFRSLLEDSVNIVVDNLNWEKSNFESCLHYFVPAISEQFLSADTTKSWTVGGIAKSDDIADDGLRNVEDFHGMYHQTARELTVQGLADQETKDVMIQSDSEEGAKSEQSHFREIIESIRRNLLHTIDTSHGLLHELRKVNLLTDQQFEVIRAKATEAEQVDQLLDELLKNASLVNQQKFFKVLQVTQQSHVIEQIRRKDANEFLASFNQLNSDCKDVETNERFNIPLLYCKEFELMDKNWCQLINFIDITNGLLDELVQCECINYEHMEDIERTSLHSAKNEKLLLIFRRKSCGDFYKLLDCLIATKQHHVVSLLQPADTAGLVKPLNERQLRSLRVNHATLVKLLDSRTSGLLTEMQAVGSITYRQKEMIEAAERATEANKRLLDIVRRGSEVDFNSFLVCLNRTNQRHISELLVNDGISVSLVVKHEAPRATELQEEVIVQKIMDLLQNTSDQLLNDHGPNIINYLKSRLAVQPSGQPSNIELIAAKTGSSIILFYRCYSISDLHDLLELNSTGELAQLTEKMYKELDNDCDLTIQQIIWNTEEFSECAHFLYALSELPVFSEIQLLAASLDRSKQELNKVRSKELPHEIVELILTKAIGQLFRLLRRLTSRAVICSLVSVSSVSCYWRETLTDCRSSCRRLLRKYFRRTCYPFLPDCPKLISRLNVGLLYGVTLTENKLYVLGYGPRPIQVFSTAEPYQHLEDITIPGLVAGIDILACPNSESLFIADFVECCIWRVSLKAVGMVEKVITLSNPPWLLSLRNQRLLVTSPDANALELYDEAGQRLNRIELPGVALYHAVETPRKTLIVSHQTRHVATKDADSIQHDNLCSVTEYSSDGLTVLRTYNVQHVRVFNDGDPVRSASAHLLVGPNDTILLADRSTRQIVVLNSQLQFESVLLCGTECHPKRLSYNEKTRKLCIGYYDTNDVIVYNV